MGDKADAVVIGAGVAGSSAACALADKGWNVVLLDKDRFPRHKACGEFISPESRSTLRALGLDDAVRSLEPAVITEVRVHTERGASLAIPLPGPAWGVSRYALDSRLQQSAQERGASLRTACQVSQVSRVSPVSEAAEAAEAEEGYIVSGSGPGSEHVRLFSRIVIGAWGRRPLSAVKPSRPLPDDRSYVGLKSHYERADRSPAVDLYFFRGGYVGISPIEGGRLNVAAIIARPAFRRLGASEAIERILERAAGHIPVLKKRLAGAAPVPGTQTATSPVTIRRVPSAWDEMPCVGDAVAVIPPFCGDGMAMALRSAELCATLADRYLRGTGTLAEWRYEYSRRIKQDFASALRWGGLLDRVLAHPFLASWMLRLGSIAPGAARKIVRAVRLKE